MDLNPTERELLEWYVEMANHPFWILKRLAVNQIRELMTMVYYSRAKWQ